MIPWWFWLIVSVGGYMLCGSAITALAVHNAPNRWVSDWFEYDPWSRPWKAKINPPTVRAVFWLWPFVAISCTVYILLRSVGFVLKFADTIMRLFKPHNVEIR